MQKRLDMMSKYGVCVNAQDNIYGGNSVTQKSGI